MNEPQKAPRVRITQDPSADPMRVVVVEDTDRNTPSIGCLAIVIFFSSLLGTLIGLGADIGDFIGSIGQIQEIINPPPTLCIAGSDTMLGSLSVGPQWETKFEDLNTVRVEINATGSTAGVRLAHRRRLCGYFGDVRADDHTPISIAEGGKYRN